MKNTELTIITLIIFFCFVFTSCSVSKQPEHQETFNKTKAALEEIKEVVVEAVKYDKNIEAKFAEHNHTGYKWYGVIRKDDDARIVGIKDFPIALTEEHLSWLNDIDELLNGLDVIMVWSNRVGFESDRFTMYVFSLDGSTPDYFYFEDDDLRFKREFLGNSWYYMRVSEW